VRERRFANCKSWAGRESATGEPERASLNARSGLTAQKRGSKRPAHNDRPKRATNSRRAKAQDELRAPLS